MKSMTTTIKQLTERVRQARQTVATARIALNELPKASTERELRYQELVSLKNIRDDGLLSMLKEKQKLKLVKHSKWLLINVSNFRF